MKRTSRGDDQPASKRHKHGFAPNGRSQPHARDHQDRNVGTHSNSHSSPRTQSTNTGHKPSTPASEPNSRDPLGTLQTLLRSLTSHAESTNKLLGPEALKSASQLLESLNTAKQTSTTPLDLFHPPTLRDPDVLPFVDPTLSPTSTLPPLPAIPEGPYSHAPFAHKSTSSHDRVDAKSDLTYERLEFLGDAYVEIMATRLIFARFPHLAAGRQSQIRERLVKNDTITAFGLAYGFRDRISLPDQDRRADGAKGAKVVADVFEAYVAAVILSDPEHGFARVEAWLTALWAPILVTEFGALSRSGADESYNSKAKMELQQMILGRETRLEYVEERPMEQSKHTQRYFVTLYLTGWGFHKKRIGYGEGVNKVEAGNRAAMDAMAQNREIVEDAARQLAAIREQKRLERDKADAKTAVDGGCG